MKFLKLVSRIKNLISFNQKQKGNDRNQNVMDNFFTEVKHPAEFLIRW